MANTLGHTMFHVRRNAYLMACEVRATLLHEFSRDAKVLHPTIQNFLCVCVRTRRGHSAQHLDGLGDEVGGGAKRVWPLQWICTQWIVNAWVR